jgi:hypothetical protein
MSPYISLAPLPPLYFPCIRLGHTGLEPTCGCTREWPVHWSACCLPFEWRGCCLQCHQICGCNLGLGPPCFFPALSNLQFCSVPQSILLVPRCTFYTSVSHMYAFVLLVAALTSASCIGQPVHRHSNDAVAACRAIKSAVLIWKVWKCRSRSRSGSTMLLYSAIEPPVLIHVPIHLLALCCTLCAFIPNMYTLD